MPNWAYTSYRIVGKTEEVNDLYGKIKQLENMQEPLVENGFGLLWLGCLVTINLSLAQAIINLSGPQIIGLVIKFLSLLQCFHKLVDTSHLFRDIDALRTLPDTLVTTHTMIGLTKFGYRTVITNQECPTEFPIILVL